MVPGDPFLDPIVRFYLTFLVAVLPVSYASNFLHELGHAVMGRRCGYLVTSFGLGIARPFWVGRWRGARVYLARTRPFQGLAFSLSPGLYPTRGQAVGMLAGGVLAQAVATAAALALWRWLPWGALVWLTVALVNGFGLLNAVPLTVNRKGLVICSDGAQALQAWRRGSVAAPVPVILQTIRSLRGLWEAVGDEPYLAASLLMGAAAWEALGDAEEARRLCDEAEGRLAGAPPFLVAFAAAVRGIVARHEGRPDDANHAFDEAEGLYRALGHELGLLLVAWGRAEALARRGDPAAAAAQVEALAALPIVRGRPTLVSGLRASRVAIRALLPDADLAALRAEYEAGRDREDRAYLDLQVHAALASASDARGDREVAEPSYRKALEAVGALDRALIDPDDRDRFRRAQADLVASARACLVDLRGDEGAAGFVSPYADAEAMAHEQAERNRRLHRIGARATILNLAIAVALAVAGVVARFEDPDRAILWFAGVAILTLYSVALVCFRLTLWLSGRLIPRLRDTGGRMAVALAVLPWVTWLSAALLVILAGP